MRKKFYVTRDQNGDLYLWIGFKPYKYHGYWWNKKGSNGDMALLPTTMFPNVKWKDKKPLEIKLISNIKFNIFLNYSDRQMILKDYNIQHHGKKNIGKKTK